MVQSFLNAVSKNILQKSLKPFFSLRLILVTQSLYHEKSKCGWSSGRSVPAEPSPPDPLLRQVPEKETQLLSLATEQMIFLLYFLLLNTPTS
jgi:hypothetical protein